MADLTNFKKLPVNEQDKILVNYIENNFPKNQWKKLKKELMVA